MYQNGRVLNLLPFRLGVIIPHEQMVYYSQFARKIGSDFCAIYTKKDRFLTNTTKNATTSAFFANAVGISKVYLVYIPFLREDFQSLLAWNQHKEYHKASIEEESER